MKKPLITFLLALITIAATSCKSEEDKLKEKMLPVLTNILLRDSIAVRIDSLIIYDIDTLTDKIIYARKAGSIPNFVDAYLGFSNVHLSTADYYRGRISSKQRQAKLYHYLGSTQLAKIELEESNEEIKKMQEETGKAQLYIDSAKTLDDLRLKLLHDIKDGKVDSITFRGYIPRFRLIGADKNGVQVKKDSLYIFLSKEMSIIPNKVI